MRSLCKIHPNIDYKYHWGCPECLKELRRALIEAKKRIDDLLELGIEQILNNTEQHYENNRLRKILFQKENVLREEFGNDPYTKEEFNKWLEQALKEDK